MIIKPILVSRKVLLLAGGLALLAAVGCNGSSNSTFGVVPVGTDADMTGTWSFDSGSPPEVSGCDGELLGFVQSMPPAFVAHIEQTGSTLSGTVAGACVVDPFPGGSSIGASSALARSSAGTGSSCSSSTITISGTVSGSTVAASLSTVVGGVAYRASFSGVVDGDTATLSATELVADGMSGSCSVSGGYVALR